MRKTFRCTTAWLTASLLAALAGPACAGTGSYHGVNWADKRDNFASDALILSGTSSADDYTARKATAQTFAKQMKAAIKDVNTVRIPINPWSANSTNWPVYKGIIDGLRAESMNVIIAYWEPNGGNGKIPDKTAFNTMWDTVEADYASDKGVIFEPMNEPRGYAAKDWFKIAADWLARYPKLAASRVLVDGEGYSSTAVNACAESSLNGTLLGVHDYTFFSSTTKNYNDWMKDLKDRVGSCASRTILTEFGTFMNKKYDFGKSSSTNDVVYFQAMNKAARDLGIGTAYWPGLRDGDDYSMTTRSGSGSSMTLSVVDQSGADNLRYGWGL